MSEPRTKPGTKRRTAGWVALLLAVLAAGLIWRARWQERRLIDAYDRVVAAGGYVELWHRRPDWAWQYIQQAPFLDDILGYKQARIVFRRTEFNEARLDAEALRWLAGSARVTEVDLAGTDTTDADLAPLAGLPWLHTLDLDDTRVTDAGVAAMLRLPNIIRVYARGAATTAVVGEDVRVAGPFVPGGPVTVDGLLHFRDLPAGTSAVVEVYLCRRGNVGGVPFAKVTLPGTTGPHKLALSGKLPPSSPGSFTIDVTVTTVGPPHVIYRVARVPVELP